MNTTFELNQKRSEVELPVSVPPVISKNGHVSPLSPDRILQLGTGFFAAKTVLSAAELGLFTELARGPLDAETLRTRLGLHPRSARDFFDALVALKLLERQAGKYSNSPEADLFLDRAKPTYVGGLLEMCSVRLFGHWTHLTEALRTGTPQNETKAGEEPFAALYSTPERLEGFLRGMTGITLRSARAIAAKFPWQQYRTFADVGTAQGAVPVQVALANPHLSGIGYDLPAVKPVFEKYAAANGVADRVRFQPGDFFKDRLPSVDVLIMGRILHDWDLEQKKVLLSKAFEALPEGGACIVYEAIIDDARRENAFGLLMSLNMLIETPGGFDFTGEDCRGWMAEAGFRKISVEHLAGPDSMVVGIK
jgi:precorrin-6B methylase 2